MARFVVFDNMQQPHFGATLAEARAKALAANVGYANT